MSVGRRDSERASRGGALRGVSDWERWALRENHDDDDEEEEEDSASGLEAGGGAVALEEDSCLEPVSEEKRSRNFWISGSMLGSFGAVLADVLDVLVGLSCAGDDGLAGEGEAQSQPMVTVGSMICFCVYRGLSRFDGWMIRLRNVRMKGSPAGSDVRSSIGRGEVWDNRLIS